MHGDAITWGEFHAVAAEALPGSRCWQGWLGYGNVLFLGFGAQFIEPTKPRPRGGFYHPVYPVQVMADWAEWELRQGTHVVVTRPESSEQDVQVLVGLRVVDVALSQHGASQITFEQDYQIVITPWKSAKCAANDAWSVRTEDGYYSTLTCSGAAYRIHGDTPKF